jgi:hypothetical protein
MNSWTKEKMEKTWKGFSAEHPRETSLTSILDFWPPEPQKDKFL